VATYWKISILYSLALAGTTVELCLLVSAKGTALLQAKCNIGRIIWSFDHLEKRCQTLFLWDSLLETIQVLRRIVLTDLGLSTA